MAKAFADMTGPRFSRQCRNLDHICLCLVYFIITTSSHVTFCQETKNRIYVGQYIQQGKTLAAQDRLAEASIPLEQALKYSPSNLELLTLLGEVKGRMSQFPESIALLRRAVALAPRSPKAHVNLAIALADAGKLPDALREASQAVSLAPHLASAHLNHARILADLHEIAEARSEFSIACRLAPENPDGYFYWSFLERESGNAEKESALLEKVVSLQPDNEKAFFLLGRSLSEQFRSADAIAALRKALAINPRSSSALYMLSREVRRTDPEEAKKLDAEFQATRERNARYEASKTIGNEAYQASINQNWPEAIRLLQSALKTCDDCEAAASLHKNLGLALCRSGDLRTGISELRVSLQLNPNDPDVVKALAVLSQ
jgi:tetratricopeptide (TPR) repeat protein